MKTRPMGFLLSSEGMLFPLEKRRRVGLALEDPGCFLTSTAFICFPSGIILIETQGLILGKIEINSRNVTPMNQWSRQRG